MLDKNSKLDNFYKNLLGYSLEKTSLVFLDKKSWDSFCFDLGYNHDSNALYLPRNQTVLIRENSPFLKLDLFHEYYGHGLFCERTNLGKKLINLEKKLFEEEKKEFGKNNLDLEKIHFFRNENKAFLDLEALRNEKNHIYEGWAIFTEYLLSSNFDNLKEFDLKYSNISEFGKSIVNQLISLKENFGDLAVHYSMGFEKYYDRKKVIKLMGDLYKGKEKNVQLSLLYGSKKPHSDIDVFSISDDLQLIDEPWIDSRVISSKEFERRINLFDICVTDPIMSGTYLFGNRDYLKKVKRQLKMQPITKKAIDYNLAYSKVQEKLSESFLDGSRDKRKHLGYAKTLFMNALNLKKGIRKFTKRELEGGNENEYRYK